MDARSTPDLVVMSGMDLDRVCPAVPVFSISSHCVYFRRVFSAEQAAGSSSSCAGHAQAYASGAYHDATTSQDGMWRAGNIANSLSERRQLCGHRGLHGEDVILPVRTSLRLRSSLFNVFRSLSEQISGCWIWYTILRCRRVGCCCCWQTVGKETRKCFLRKESGCA